MNKNRIPTFLLILFILFIASSVCIVAIAFASDIVSKNKGEKTNPTVIVNSPEATTARSTSVIIPTGTPDHISTTKSTATPTDKPKATPTATPTSIPTATPTAKPIATPTSVPTSTPKPTVVGTLELQFVLNSDGNGYTVYDGGYGEYKEGKKVDIPETYKGKPVTTIGEESFMFWRNLENLTIPNNVSTIGRSAFNYCTSLKTVNIPSSVHFIDVYAFSNCSKLTDIYYDGTYEQFLQLFPTNSVFPNWDVSLYGPSDDIIWAQNVLKAHIHTTDSASDGFKYTDNNNGTCTITGIGSCKDKNIYIPCYINNLKVVAIGERAFENQSGFKNLHIPGTVTNIGTRAFSGCSGLTEIYIPISVDSIGTQIFYKANNLNTVFYNSWYCPSTENENPFLNNSSIKKLVFGGSFIIENAAKYLGFMNSVEVIEISENVKDIGLYAFRGCTKLTEVIMHSKMDYFGFGAFMDCNSITSFVIPNHFSSIDGYLFAGCGNLKSITIPSGITSIGYHAFWLCHSLSTVYFTGSIEEWCKISFAHCESQPCHNGSMIYINNLLLEQVNIPNTISIIGPYAFYGCDSITSVTIPDSVTSIGKSAFAYCSNLSEITISDSVTVIEGGAFASCESLNSITIPNSITRIDNYAFSDCPLTSIYYNGTIDEWNSINAQDYWTWMNDGCSIYCNNGEITKPQ